MRLTSALPAAASQRLTQQRAFVLFWCARTSTNGAFMMQGVAVGWQIYDLTNDPLDLGLVGLVQFFPLIAMSVIAGQVLDLFDRRVIAAVCQAGKALAALLLAVGSAQGWLSREAMLAILFLAGTARAFEIRPCTRCCRAWCRWRCCRAPSPPPPPPSRPP